jgi:2-hydroxychromene-2-carboxylate isomerase
VGETDRTDRAEIVKLYFDYKSPFAYLAKDPAFVLPDRYRVELRWIPYGLRIKGKGERSIASEWKARYSYLDARRWANARPQALVVKGPLKVYDSTASLVGGLYAQREGFFRSYTDLVYRRFFERALEIDRPEEVARAIDEVVGRGAGPGCSGAAGAAGGPGTAGASGYAYLAYLAGEGRDALARCAAEAEEDHVFGVPLFLFRGEPFWGHDRMGLLEERLTAAGLHR